jgi:hypothetical protein
MATAAHELEHAHRPDTSSIATNRWGPYSGASDFTSNMAVVLAALLALLALALALNAAIRYLLRRRRRPGEAAGGGGRGAASAPGGAGVLGLGDQARGRRGGVRHLPGRVRRRGRRARHAGLRPRLPRAMHRQVARRQRAPLVVSDMPRPCHRTRTTQGEGAS